MRDFSELQIFVLNLSFHLRLWHQLTVELEQFIQNPMWREGDFLIKMYHNFLSSFQEKLNQLKLAQIAIVISRQIKGTKKIYIVNH